MNKAVTTNYTRGEQIVIKPVALFIQITNKNAEGWIRRPASKVLYEEANGSNPIAHKIATDETTRGRRPHSNRPQEANRLGKRKSQRKDTRQKQ